MDIYLGSQSTISCGAGVAGIAVVGAAVVRAVVVPLNVFSVISMRALRPVCSAAVVLNSKN